MKTERKTVKETIFRKTSSFPIPFKDIDIELHPEDIIQSGYDEGFHTDNESEDPHYYLEVKRERLENDDEYQKRIRSDEHLKKYLKERRYNTYLKLKDEFENGVENTKNNVAAEAFKSPKYCRFCGKCDGI